MYRVNAYALSCVHVCNLSSEYWSSQMQCWLHIKWRFDWMHWLVSPHITLEFAALSEWICDVHMFRYLSSQPFLHPLLSVLPVTATLTHLIQMVPLHIQFSMELSLNCSAVQWLLKRIISLEVSLGTGQLTTQVGVYTIEGIYWIHHYNHTYMNI